MPRTEPRSWTQTFVWVSAVVAAIGMPLAVADNFESVQYDARKDELVARMIYRGTNAHHGFSLKWGRCQGLDNEPGHQIAADVLDDQWDDAALRTYRRTVRFALKDMPCRPARVTLRTPPRFFYTVLIPRFATAAPR